MSFDHLESLVVSPIGYVRGDKKLKFDTRHQPDGSAIETHEIVLNPGNQFELALQDLEGFDRVWLIWWFHLNSTWRPRVLPPRGPAKRRGVFATRSPHRPNPIGITCVPLISVDGLVITVGPVDLVDGTPILDIKPYLPYADAFPASRHGWIEEVDQELASAPRHVIEIATLAHRQIQWLEERGIDLTTRAFSILQIDPRPHRTRRILEVEPGLFRIACGAWRMYYRIQGPVVTIEYIAKGYADDSLSDPGRSEIPHREAQIAFALTDFDREPLRD